MTHTQLTGTRQYRTTLTAPVGETDEPGKRFEDLTRRLVNVPKDEIDREAEKDLRGKKK